MGRISTAMKRVGLLLCALLLVLPLASCGGKELTLYEYKKKLQRTTAAGKALQLLNDMAEVHDLGEKWSPDWNSQIRRGLADSFLPDTAVAEPVRTLPESFQDKKWIALFNDAGVLRLYGELFVHLPARMRAASLKEAEAVLYMEHTREPSSEETRWSGPLVNLNYTLYAKDLGSGQVYRLFSTQVMGVSDRSETDSSALWERVIHAVPMGRKRTLMEDVYYFRSLDDPDDELAALYDLARDHADYFARESQGPDLTESISYRKKERLAAFVPDFEKEQSIEALSEGFQNRKYICLEISTSVQGDDYLYWRGDLYVRLPEELRAATLEEADAAIIVHKYQTKQRRNVTYYYSDGTMSSFDYVPGYSYYLYDKTGDELIRPRWREFQAGLAENLGRTEATSAPQAADWASLSAGDTLFFGAYEQDGKAETGPEPIEWIVLDKNDRGLLLLSQYELACRPYHAGENEQVTWEACALRTWLNDTFLQQAFRQEERSRMLTLDDSGDKVFLLSGQEAHTYLPSKLARQTEPTAVAKAEQQGVRMRNGWWLSIGTNPVKYASYVMQSGSYTDTDELTYGHYVRPALWIDLG